MGTNKHLYEMAGVPYVEGLHSYLFRVTLGLFLPSHCCFELVLKALIFSVGDPRFVVVVLFLLEVVPWKNSC